MALLPGSPAIGGGMSGAGIPTADQRGQSRAGHTDIGSFQSQGFNLTPVAHSTPQSATAGKGFSNPLAVTVTAKNLAEPVDGGVVRFSGPATGASAGLSAGTAAIQGGQAAVTATANDLPGGYTVTATAAGTGSAAFDLTNTASLGLTHENPSPGATGGQPGTPSSPESTPGVIVVGPITLREAVAIANSHPGPDSIVFDPAFYGKKHRTIKVIGGPLALTDPAITTIIGPGARWLTVRGGGRGPLFEVHGGSLALSGLTIRGGRARHSRGGGLLNDGGTVSLAHAVIRDNSAPWAGRSSTTARRH